MNSARPTPESIPAPLRRYWREFRIQWLPLIVFVLVGACAGGLWQEVIMPHTVVGTEADPGPDDPASDAEPDGSDDPAACAQKQTGHSASYTTNLGVRTPRLQD